MKTMPTMQCGHQGLGTFEGEPVCLVCFPKPESMKLNADPPDVTGRRARCCYYGSRAKGRKCTGEEDSHYGLPFFHHRPGEEFDSYYCGCWGWD
jgi:hypothetical protein